MPWFLTATISDFSRKKFSEGECPPTSRCFGFFNSYSQAVEVIDQNRGNMRECLYDLLVLEYIEEGIHPTVHKAEWWAWAHLSDKWVALEFVPYEFRGITNWALG